MDSTSNKDVEASEDNQNPKQGRIRPKVSMIPVVLWRNIAMKSTNIRNIKAERWKNDKLHGQTFAVNSNFNR